MRFSSILPPLLLLLTGAADAVAMADCAEAPVRYSEPTLAPLAGRVVVTPLPTRPTTVREETDRGYQAHSPQRGAAFNRVAVADTARPGPRRNNIEVFSTRGPPVAWRLEFDELHDNVELRWLNDELLFLRAWWGRIVSTDLILDLGSGRFIYAREANHAAQVQPCEASGTAGD